MITAGGSMDYLISVNLYETCNKNFGLSINRKGISIAREQPEQTLFISQAFFSKGLLLCVWRNNKSRLLVWNLYWGKRRWIECLAHCLNEKFAFGYDRSCGSHKILRFSNDNPNMEIYYLSSDSWRTYDASFNRNTIKYTEPGLSLKGNPYWYARDYESGDAFLHCFDFTRERFGPRLPLTLFILFLCLRLKRRSLQCYLPHGILLLGLIFGLQIRLNPARCPGANSLTLKRCNTLIIVLTLAIFLLTRRRR